MKKIFIFGVVMMTLASCSIQKQTTNTAKTLGIYGAGVIQRPVLANLKITEKKVSTFYSADNMQDLNFHKSQAIAKSLIENKADVIIEPSYEIVTSGSSVKITLTGFAGTYENFRLLTGAYTSLLMDIGIGNYNNSEKDVTPQAAPAKKKKLGGILLLLILIGAASASAYVL